MGNVYAYCSWHEENTGYVYFIRDGMGNIKIGITNDIQNRLNALQTANPHKLEYYAGLKVKSMDDARKIEAELHGLFDKYRLIGEWFSEKPVLEFLKQDRVEICGYVFNLGFDEEECRCG